ncbi:uncharacterized protein LOC135702116, partial [Ochlerotatus camptorhynchus]|uniref:uncharacterized protein LOC135702116 n=1 Tax=Ochlerotatus camptorhynchus TaxID=644619 RepID=UPI0031D6745A
KFRRHLKSHLLERMEQVDQNPRTSKQSKNEYQEAEERMVQFIQMIPVDNELALPSTSTQTATMHLQNSLSSLDRLAINFVIDLHRKRNFNRKDVTDILKDVHSVYSNIGRLISTAAPTSQDVQQQYVFDMYVRKVSNIFEFIDTEHKLFKYLEEADLYKKPNVYVIHIDKVELYSDRNVETPEKRTYLTMSNVKYQIRKFFELGNVLKKTLEHMENLQKSARLENFVNGALFKTVEAKCPEKIIIPIFFYSDEFEINDPLSAHNKRWTVCSLERSGLEICYNFVKTA